MTNKTPYKIGEDMKRCVVCGFAKKVTDFYYKKDKNLGRSDKCKSCMTKDIVNNSPETFTPYLKELGYPYIEPEWENCIKRQEHKDLSKSRGGQHVFGSYIVCMQRSQYKEFTYETSDKALEYYNSLPEHRVKLHTPDSKGKELIKSPDATFLSESDMSLEDELTLEDKQYLATKWGTTFTPNEWVQLEKQFVGMKESFPIEDAGRENDLKLVCKVTMKANQALDAMDYKSFKELMQVYNQLMKSGKFTAAQNKENGDNQINSAAELVMRCERQKGFIPKFCTDIPQDKVDITIDNMKEYLKNLVMKDLGFGKTLENAIKKIEKEMEKKNKDIKGESQEEEINARQKSVFAQLQRQIEEDSDSLDEADSDDFLKEFCKEEGDDIPFMGEEEIGEDIE